MTPIIVMLCGAIFFIVIFFVCDYITTNYYLKKHQKEWDELKSAVIETNPNIQYCELLGIYVDFCEEKEHYLPRFGGYKNDTSN